MNNETGKQLIKSAAAILCVASVCISAVISTNKIATMIKDTANSSSVQQTGTSDNVEAAATESIIIGEPDVIYDDTDTASDDAEQVDTAQADDTAADTGSDSSSSSASGTSSSTSSSSTKTTTTKKASTAPQTKAEIINYCNTALNNAKAAKIGYDKKLVREVKGSTDGISQSLIKLVEANKSTTMKKGSSDIKDDFPAAGYDWSSKLREQDVTNATIKTNGQYYEIKLTLGTEQNPAKGESSSYGRVMSVIDSTEAGKMVPGIKSINMTYHDGYVYAKINSSTGKLVSAEFCAAADIQASIAIFGDISVKDVTSVETITNIVW